MPKYHITTVDWNPEQTTLWLHHLRKNCRDFSVSLLPNVRRFASCWSSPKLNCLNQEFDTQHVIYMDTDTIVTRDLWEMFEWMGDAELGLSLCLGTKQSLHALTKPHGEEILSSFGLSKFPRRVPTGLMVFNKISPKTIYDGWCEAFSKIDAGWPDLPGKWGQEREGWSNEVSFSFWLARQRMRIKDIPKEFHHYLLSNDTYISRCKTLPMIIHYHSRLDRVRRAGLDYLLSIE